MNRKVAKGRIGIGKILIVLLVLVLIVGVGAGSYAFYNIYNGTEKFDANRLMSSGVSKMYDINGNVIYTYGSDENGKRQNITYDDLPQVLVDAVISAEDSRYFEHNGFDLPRIAKAAIGNFKSGGITSGGSTITQQLIKKTYFPDAQKSYVRKIREILLSIEADKTLSKEEILTLYLNKIYFGRSTDSIGISAACNYYFNKDVTEITLPEAALLAGSLNSPYNYDPYYNLTKATKRRDTILNLMVTHGYITKEECELAKQTKVENTLSRKSTESNTEYAAYIDLVTEEVVKKTGLNPKQAQLNIYTYCDPEIQSLCTKLGNGEAYQYSDEDMRMGGCVQSSQDGRIIGVIGGRNYKIGDFNYAINKQQPGSSVKPFLDYGLAFEKCDWCTGQTILDAKLEGKFQPKNWDGKFHGTVNVRTALVNSWNIPAVKTYMEVEKEIGPDGITKAMESIGISMEGEDPNIAYAIGGWAHGISPREMCSAYATISNNGLYTEGHTINYVENVQTGEVFSIDKDIQANKTQSEYSEQAAYMVRYLMTDYTKSGSGNYAYLRGIKNVGAKTGTSNWPAGARKGMGGRSRDIWMSAYNTDYICSVWMGFGQEGISKGKTTSAYKAYSGKVVQSIMMKLQERGYTKEYPPMPGGLVKKGDCLYKEGTKHEHAKEKLEEETEDEEVTEDDNPTEPDHPGDDTGGDHGETGGDDGGETGGDHGGDHPTPGPIPDLPDAGN